MIDRNLFLSSDGITFDGKRAVPNEEVTAMMLELADLQPGEKVLEIGTGSGYQFAHLHYAVYQDGGSVCTVDREPLGIGPWEAVQPGLIVGSEGFSQHDGRLGWKEHAPFDCIWVSCGMTSIPPAYEEQLREGGRLIIPLGKPDGQELLRLEKRSGKLVMGRVGGYVRFQMCV